MAKRMKEKNERKFYNKEITNGKKNERKKRKK